MIRFGVVLAVGYVLGTKAGRHRYEQIAGTYRAVTGSPKTKAVLDAGRKKLAERVSPEPKMKVASFTPIDAQTSVSYPDAGQNRSGKR